MVQSTWPGQGPAPTPGKQIGVWGWVRWSHANLRSCVLDPPRGHTGSTHRCTLCHRDPVPAGFLLARPCKKNSLQEQSAFGSLRKLGAYMCMINSPGL